MIICVHNSDWFKALCSPFQFGDKGVHTTKKSMAHQRIWLKKMNNQLGIAVTGVADCGIIKADYPIYIALVLEGEAAHQDGRLEVGDRIFKVNGKSLIGISHVQAIDMLSQSGDVVELEVARFNPALRERRNKKNSNSENQNDDGQPHATQVQEDGTEQPSPTRWRELPGPVPHYLAVQISKLISILSLVLTLMMILLCGSGNPAYALLLALSCVLCFACWSLILCIMN